MPSSQTVSSPSSTTFAAPCFEEIDAAVAPYIVRRMPAESSEWREIAERVARKERKKSFRQKVKEWLPSWRGARPQSLVKTHYETHWSAIPWPRTFNPDPGEKTVISTWRDEGLLIRRYGRKRAHHLVFGGLLPSLPIKTALEVGCGNGINLFVLSALFPEIQWSGVELTEAGVAVAQSVQGEAELPPILRDFAVKPVTDPTAHRRIAFRQGDASALPFPDKSFDLVFTFQALEQMQAIRDSAVKELARVAKTFVVMTEPFTDFNQAPMQKDYRAKRDYLNLATGELPGFGLAPEFVFADFPQKMTSASGVVLCRTAS